MRLLVPFSEVQSRKGKGKGKGRMPYITQKEVTCSKCSETIAVGEQVSWNRLKRGEVYHSPECPALPDGVALVAEPTEVTPVSPKPTMPAAPKRVHSWKAVDWWHAAEAASQTVSRIFLYGPPGTGKSTVARTLPVKGHGKVYRITCTENTTDADLRGSWQLIGGETKWVDGRAVRALREGSRLVLEEVDRASSEVKSLLYSLMDSPAQVDIPTGELIEAADGYQVISTSNESPDCLPPAIADRQDAFVYCPTPHPAILRRITNAPLRALTKNYYLRVSQPIVYKPEPTVRRALAFTTLTEAGIQPECASQIVYCDARAEIHSMMSTCKPDDSEES